MSDDEIKSQAETLIKYADLFPRFPLDGKARLAAIEIAKHFLAGLDANRRQAEEDTKPLGAIHRTISLKAAAEHMKHDHAWLERFRKGKGTEMSPSSAKGIAREIDNLLYMVLADLEAKRQREVDDALPVTEEWLREIGLFDSSSYGNQKRFCLFGDSIRVILQACSGPECWKSELWCGTNCAKHALARRDVRRLLEGLGVPLKEGT